MQLPHINLGRRARLALRIGGFVVLGLIAFLFALQLTFNYERVKDKFLVEALAGSYDVTVGNVKRGIMPGKFTLEKVALISRPAKEGDPITRMDFEEIECNVGVLSLITGAIAVDFDAVIGKGTLSGTIEMAMNGSKFSLTATGHRINGDAIPQIKDTISLPLLGKLDLAVSLTVGKGDWREASGYFQLACPKGCTLGDGQTKYKPKVKSQRTATMMGDGIEWGRLEIDKLLARIELKKGKLEIAKWDFESRDAELHPEFAMKLGKKLKESELETGCFRFKALPALQARESKTATAITMIGGLLGPDGLFHVKLECQGGGQKCTYAGIKAKGRVCSGEGSSDDSGDVAKGPPKLTTGGDIVKAAGSGSAAPPPGEEPGADITPTPTPTFGSGSNANGGSSTTFAPGSGSGSAPPMATGSGQGSNSDVGSGDLGSGPGVSPDTPRGTPPAPTEQPIQEPPPPPEQPPPVAPKENE